MFGCVELPSPSNSLSRGCLQKPGRLHSGVWIKHWVGVFTSNHNYIISRKQLDYSGYSPPPPPPPQKTYLHYVNAREVDFGGAREQLLHLQYVTTDYDTVVNYYTLIMKFCCI